MKRSIISAAVVVLVGTLSFACGGASGDVEDEEERTAQESSAMKCTAMWTCSRSLFLNSEFCGSGLEYSCSFVNRVCKDVGGTFTMVNCHGAF